MSVVDFLANYTTNSTALIESEYFDLLTNGTNITRADAYFFYNNTAKSIIASFDLDNSSGLNLTEFTNMLTYGTTPPPAPRAAASQACSPGRTWHGLVRTRREGHGFGDGQSSTQLESPGMVPSLSPVTIDATRARTRTHRSQPAGLLVFGLRRLFAAYVAC
jgi:hypothetical protein